MDPWAILEQQVPQDLLDLEDIKDHQDYQDLVGADLVQTKDQDLVQAKD